MALFWKILCGLVYCLVVLLASVALFIEQDYLYEHLVESQKNITVKKQLHAEVLRTVTYDAPLDPTLFTKRERDHMQDVHRLYASGMVFLFIFLIVFALLAFANLSDLANIVHTASMWFLIVIIALSVYVFVAFERSFVFFHEIFFSNDLWLLPPDSLLLWLYPASFFLKSFFFIVGQCIFFHVVVFFLTGNKSKNW